MPTADINGFTMYYEQGGDDTPLVYVHGGNTCLLHALLYGRRPFHWGWRQDFTEHFRFTWYERRGCYRSSTPDDDYWVMLHITGHQSGTGSTSRQQNLGLQDHQSIAA